MKETKRIISLMLVLALVLSFVPCISVSAEETDTESIAVDVAAGSGSMNLTEVGSADWIHVTSSETNRKADSDGNSVGILSFETVGDITLASMSDSAVAYSWSDGTPTSEKSGYTYGGVVGYKNGDVIGDVTEEAGWTVSVPAQETTQTLTFVAGVWAAKAEITIKADGDVVYTSSDLGVEDTSSKLLTHTVTINPGVAVEVSAMMTSKSHTYGNMSIGGIALAVEEDAEPEESTPEESAPEESTPSVSNSVVVGVAVGSGSMDLTEVGSSDWMHITYDNINRKAVDGEAVGILSFETVGGITLGTNMSDSAVAYSWSDGTPTESKSGYTYGGVLSYNNGSHNGEITEEAGWKITVPAQETLQTLTFVSGIWAASAEIYIKADGVVAYSNEELTADMTSTLLTYTVTINPGVEVEIYGVMTNKTHSYGNMSIGGIALDIEEPAGPSVAVDVATASGTMNLTEVGTADWVHLTGSDNGPAENRKAVDGEAVNLISFETSENLTMKTTMHDSAVAYSWSDGTPTESKSGYTYGGVMSYQNGTYQGAVSDEANAYWQISVPASNTIQTLTFVSGVWQASTEINIYVNGDTTNPVYTNSELTADGTSKLLQYTVTVSPDTSIEVVGKLTNKGHTYGNVSMGGIALSQQELDDSQNYIKLLEDAVETAKAWLNEDIDEYFINQLEAALESGEAALAKGDALTQSEAYGAYVFLDAAIAAVENAQSGSYANTYASGMSGSFGWEGDKDAPIAYIDGTYYLRDNGGAVVTFGVTGLDADSVSWYNAEGYLPCFVSEYGKNGLEVKIESFSDLVVIDGNDYEIAYSRMTVTNTTEETKLLPRVSSNLVALTDTASAKSIAAGETIVRDYCIGADRFGNSYDYPADEVLAQQGSWDEHYAHMETYWNDRLDAIISIESVPEAYEELINAYKAGYIYMLIISDGYELHVGENGYDRVFDHDVIGMLASLIESGHTENFADYAQYILLNVQYPDARWKYSWPFALYLQKTGDYDTILSFWSDIKKNTHYIGNERVVYDASILDEDGNAARIMKQTYAIDTYGYWVIDNYASLFGLTTYSYVCEQLYEKYGTEEYKTEYEWAQAEYDSLLKSVEAVLGNTMEKYDFNIVPISMVTSNENSGRSDPRDGNWAAHYLFGRWDWDGYLFGADQDSWLHDLVDDTYNYIIDMKSTEFDSPYNMGGYPHGYYSSAYNAGYFSAALSGEQWRDGGIEAYLWMIENAQGCPFGWWEGVAYPDETNVWNIESSNGGGGSCQHMWGQSTATKVLIDSFFAEKADGTIIAGRGLPEAFNADGERIAVSNYLCSGGKRIGFEMVTSGETITFTLTGDALDNAVSLELPVLVNNITSVSDGCAYDSASGTVTIPAGVTTVTIVTGSAIDEETANVIALIDVIGEVTLDSETAIETARAAYDALTDAQKAQVGNYDVLTAAEAALAELKEAAAIRQAIDWIDAIGEVTLNSGDAIQAAREAYDALTDEQQEKVTNYEVLKAAEQNYAVLRAKAAAEAAEAAQAAAEAAQAAAEAAQAKADEAAQKAADAAAAAGTDSEAAKQAAVEAVEAQANADEAAKAAEDAKTAAELAAQAAESSTKEAAESAALAAEYAQKVAETYKEICDMKAEMADQLAQAQKAALASAKYYALIQVAELANALDTDDLAAHHVKAYEDAVADARGQIENAASVEEADAVAPALEQTLKTLSGSCYAKNYTDVNLDSWYHESVDYMIGNGCMNGISDNEFAPDADTTRAMMVTILYRIAGEPSVEGMSNPFTDVPANKWYTNAVIWAADEGIVEGIVSGLFSPDKAITREQIVTILYRCADAEPVSENALAGYEDAADVSSWAKDAMNWAVSEGLVQGVSATELIPTDLATRAQIAAILMRYLEK